MIDSTRFLEKLDAIVDNYFTPKRSIPSISFVSIALSVVGLSIGTWCIATYGNFTNPDFLPAPHKVVLAGLKLAGDGSLWRDMKASVSVIFTGFALASIFAVPIGILVGAFHVARALVEPFVNFMRYLPISALVPLLILWIGIGFEQKVAVIFLGTFFQQIVLVSDVSAAISKDLLDASYTLGVNRRQVIRKVLIPASMPGVMDTLRITMGWAWTYLVLAELVAANAGLGYSILNSMRGLFTDRIFLDILVIGLLGLITDMIFKAIRRIMLPWASD